MQPDYQKIMAEQQKKEQGRYQQTRDPFEYGRQVAQRRYSEIMSGLDAQRSSMNQTYGDMYQAARQRAVGQQAAGGPTLSGGMGQQQRDFVSALEMQELGKIGQAREQAGRDLYTQAQSAMSNAQLEGQQATQMELQNQQAALQVTQQRQSIINDPNLNEAQKKEQLEAMGVDTSNLNLKAENTGLIGQWGKLINGEASFSEAAGTVISSVVAIAATVLAIKYGGKLIKFLGGKVGKGATPQQLSNAAPTMSAVFARSRGGATAAAQVGTAAATNAATNAAGQLALPAPRTSLPFQSFVGGGRPLSASATNAAGQLLLPAPDYWSMGNIGTDNYSPVNNQLFGNITDYFRSNFLRGR